MLAGEPQLAKHKIDWAWLTLEEIQDRLRKQGEDAKWEEMKGMLGATEEVDTLA